MRRRVKSDKRVKVAIKCRVDPDDDDAIRRVAALGYTFGEILIAGAKYLEDRTCTHAQDDLQSSPCTPVQGETKTKE